jgi:hypothetical protein
MIRASHPPATRARAMGVQSMWSSYFEAEILEEGDHEKRGLGNTGVALVRKNGQEKTSRWIGVDLDGTLAKSIVPETRSALQSILWCNW